MVSGRVDEDIILVPGATLDTDVLVDRTQVLQLAVTDGNGCNTFTLSNQTPMILHSAHVHCESRTTITTYFSTPPITVITVLYTVSTNSN